MSLLNTSIIVSSDEATITTITQLFNDNEFTVFSDIDTTIEHIESTELLPDLFFLDVLLANSDGFALCRYIRMQLRLAEIPVIMMSAESNTFTEEHCFDLGASDYLSKPLSNYLLVARVSHHLQLQEQRQLLQQQKQKMARERHAVEAIINHVRAALAPVNEAKFQYFLTPLEQTSGDMVLKNTTPDGREIILLGDFTGHGLTAAVASPMVGSQFLADTLSNLPAVNIIARLNQMLCEHLPTGHFMAAGLIELNRSSGQMTVWNAAMPEFCVFS